MRQSLDPARSPHPRLLTSQAGLQAVRQWRIEDPLRRQLADTVIRQAELILDVDPITRTLQGRRLLGQSRTCVQRVITLAMAFHLTEDFRYARRAEKEMLAAARFEDWNPSHFLDVAEMTFALAIGYDWLHDHLDEAARIEIGDAIIQKGVSLPFTTPHHGWVRSGNNRGQVCHGGLTAGALAVMERDLDLAARTVHQAVRNVTHSMAVFAPKGSYPEGPGYWAYGTGYNVLLISVLESALGTDFGLSQAPGFDQTGQYPNLVGGPSGAFFNYADGGAGRGPQPFLFWFARSFQSPRLVAGRTRAASGAACRPWLEIHPRRRGDRFLPLTLLWLTTAAEPDRHSDAAPLAEPGGNSDHRPSQFLDGSPGDVRRFQGRVAFRQPRADGYRLVCARCRRRSLGHGSRGRGLSRHRIAWHEPLGQRRRIRIVGRSSARAITATTPW